MKEILHSKPTEQKSTNPKPIYVHYEKESYLTFQPTSNTQNFNTSSDSIPDELAILFRKLQNYKYVGIQKKCKEQKSYQKAV